MTDRITGDALAAKLAELVRVWTFQRGDDVRGPLTDLLAWVAEQGAASTMPAVDGNPAQDARPGAGPTTEPSEASGVGKPAHRRDDDPIHVTNVELRVPPGQPVPDGITVTPRHAPAPDAALPSDFPRA